MASEDNLIIVIMLLMVFQAICEGFINVYSKYIILEKPFKAFSKSVANLGFKT